MYQFGAFRLDSAKRILLRDNQSVALTPKGFEILLFLLQNRDRVVPKEELLSRLWPDTFVGEANLSQNLFVLRKALGESAQDQRYIVTVRGTGYRFAEDVQEIRENGKIELEPIKQSDSGPGKTKLTPDFLRRQWVMIAVVLIAATAATLYFRRNHPTRSSAGNDTIVLADFENRTGDPVFDDTFSQALLIELEQSPFLKILSTERVNDTLKRMNLQPGSRLRPPIALEVCEREDAKAVLAGSISTVGKQYLLAIEAFACRDGSLLASEQSRSESKEGTLDALSRNASQIRLKLGESLPSVEKFDRPLREVTTSSLEALKAYSSAAQMLREERNEPAAAKMLERAIELDPQFAMAYEYLAIAHYHMGDEDRAAVYQTKAYALRDRVSERERLSIMHIYHLLVTGDVEEQMKTAEQWSEEFPRDYLPLHELGGIYSDLGQYDRCIEEHELAWKLEPKQPYSPTWIAGCDLALDHIREARNLMELALRDNPESPDVHATFYDIALMQDDAPAMRTQSAWSGVQSATGNIAVTIAASLVQRGQIKSAREIVDRQIAELRDQGHAESAALAAARMAVWAAETSDLTSARRYSAQSRNLFKGRLNSMLVAWALLLAGDTEAGKSITDEMARRYPADTVVQRVGVPLARALVDMEGPHPHTAITDLEPTVRYENGSMGGFAILYVRGLAYLKNRQSDEAANTFRRILEHRGKFPEVPEWSLAHLGLARAFGMQLTDPNQGREVLSKSRSAYEEFFTLCRDADSNFLPLQQAKAEYSKLQ